MLDAIDAARTKHQLDVWAYVIMPEHVHLLLQGNSGQSLIFPRGAPLGQTRIARHFNAGIVGGTPRRESRRDG